MVTGLVTTPDDNLFYVESDLVSVHTFDRTRTLAKRAGKDTDRRMEVPGQQPPSDIVMGDGRLANVDYLEVLEAAITRTTGRQRQALRLALQRRPLIRRGLLSRVAADAAICRIPLRFNTIRKERHHGYPQHWDRLGNRRIQ
jgi:hypothetical protein